MSAEHTVNRDGHELKGIGGWLLVLVAYLFLFEPLRAVAVLLALWSNSGSAALQNVFLIGAIVQTAIAAFSLYTGIALLRLQSNAVSVAKIYFVVMLTLGLLQLGLVILGAVLTFYDTAIRDMARAPAAIASVIQVLISGAWLIYLEQSKRVRATFSGG